MAKLTTIPGIGKTSEELLEVAGFLDVESLAKAGVDELVAALEKANDILKISKKTPPRAAVEKWVAHARESLGLDIEVEEEVEPIQMPVNYEGNPEVEAMLGNSPAAIPLPGKVMMENKLAVSDIPAGILLNRYSGDLEVRVSNRTKPAPEHSSNGSGKPAVQVDQPVVRDNPSASPKAASTPLLQRLEVESKLDIDTSRVKTFEEFSNQSVRVKRSKEQEQPDRVALLRAPLEKTNRGKDPNSRWYIKGVLHTHPGSLALGAIITLLLMIVLPVALVSATLLFISDQFPGTLPWVPKWFLAFPLALPVLGFLYLSFGLGGKCRICGQRLFWPRHCRKNSKAHHIPGIGHIVPTSLHMLVFKWFRCIYCGTPVRLKK